MLEPVDAVDSYYGRFGPPRYASLEEIEKALEDAAQVDSWPRAIVWSRSP